MDYVWDCHFTIIATFLLQLLEKLDRCLYQHPCLIGAHHFSFSTICVLVAHFVRPMSMSMVLHTYVIQVQGSGRGDASILPEEDASKAKIFV